MQDCVLDTEVVAVIFGPRLTVSPTTRAADTDTSMPACSVTLALPLPEEFACDLKVRVFWSPDGARETVIFTVGLHVSVTPTFPVAVSFM
jgi:hypothetical protein